jgi:GntR family transcriptional regulator, transcriptional repressor for pyruvate dehydrogenase complex
MTTIDSPVERSRPRGLAQDIVRQYAQRIRSHTIQPGEKLPTEAQIMREFSVSRTVVREAISRLHAAHLVDTQHGVGTFAAAKPPEDGLRLSGADISTTMDILSVLELRISLETESAALAAQRREEQHLSIMRRALDTFEANLQSGGNTALPDVEFHLQIAQATGNRYFVEVLSHLGHTLLPRTRQNAQQLSATDQLAYLKRINQEHEQIYDSIARRDQEGARAAMRLHLSNGLQRQRQLLTQSTQTSS